MIKLENIVSPEFNPLFFQIWLIVHVGTHKFISMLVSGFDELYVPKSCKYF